MPDGVAPHPAGVPIPFARPWLFSTVLDGEEASELYGGVHGAPVEPCVEPRSDRIGESRQRLITLRLGV
jgi:hypothetical protein